MKLQLVEVGQAEEFISGLPKIREALFVASEGQKEYELMNKLEMGIYEITLVKKTSPIPDYAQGAK